MRTILAGSGSDNNDENLQEIHRHNQETLDNIEAGPHKSPPYRGHSPNGARRNSRNFLTNFRNL